jgi:hypothetical protein
MSLPELSAILAVVNSVSKCLTEIKVTLSFCPYLKIEAYIGVMSTQLNACKTFVPGCILAQYQDNFFSIVCL